MAKQPQRLEFVGDFLAVRWTDGTESVVGLKTLRERCPCAHCSGEPDVTGAVRMPAHRPVLNANSFVVAGTERIGSYAIAFEWADGHRTGIYSWDLIERLADLDAE